MPRCSCNVFLQEKLVAVSHTWKEGPVSMGSGRRAARLPGAASPGPHLDGLVRGAAKEVVAMRRERPHGALMSHKRALALVLVLLADQRV